MVVALNMKHKKQKKQCEDMCCFEGCSLLFKGKDADSAKRGWNQHVKSNGGIFLLLTWQGQSHLGKIQGINGVRCKSLHFGSLPGTFCPKWWICPTGSWPKSSFDLAILVKKISSVSMFFNLASQTPLIRYDMIYYFDMIWCLSPYGSHK